MICYCDISASAYTSAGPLSLKQNGVYTFVITSGRTDCHWAPSSQSANASMNAAVSGLTDAVRTMGQSVSKPRLEDLRVGKPEPYAPGKDFDDWDFTFNRYDGTLGPAYPALQKAARQSATAPHEEQCAAAVPSYDNQTNRSTKDREKSWKQWIRSLQTAVADVRNVRSRRQHGTVRAKHDVQVRFQNRRRVRPSERISGTGETIRRANGTDPVPDQVKKACIISNTPGPLKTHLQLNVAKQGNFNAPRVATGDYLRSRRIFKTTSAGNTQKDDPMEIDAVSRKGKGKGKSGKDKRSGKKGKESHSGKGYGETTTEHSRFDGECRNSGKYGHEAADCRYKQPPKPQGKRKASLNPK